MKVACVGNINNMLFVLTRYLRDNGIDCDLLLFNNEQPHFHPSCDSFTDDYKTYTKKLSWGSIETFAYTTDTQINQDLAEYDFIIATQSLSFFNKAGITVDVFFPAGADLINTPFVVDKLTLIQKLRQRNLVKYIEAHKAGIENSLVINQEPFSAYFRKPLTRLDVIHKTHYFGSPLVYQPMYETINPTDTNNKFQQLRSENDLLIVNQARQLWKSHDKIGHESKGSDNLIRGYAQFMESGPSIETHLVLFEYGEDVNASKELIAHLGISDAVTWVPKVSRKVLMSLVSLADFSCGEFGPGCIGGLTSWEALSVGTCLLHYMDETIVKFDNFTGIYPFVNVKNPSDIRDVFKDYLVNKKKYKDIGQKGAIWYKENFEKKSLEEWLRLIELKARGGSEAITEYIKTKTNELV